MLCTDARLVWAFAGGQKTLRKNDDVSKLSWGHIQSVMFATFRHFKVLVHRLLLEAHSSAQNALDAVKRPGVAHLEPELVICGRVCEANKFPPTCARAVKTLAASAAESNR